MVWEAAIEVVVVVEVEVDEEASSTRETWSSKPFSITRTTAEIYFKDSSLLHLLFDIGALLSFISIQLFERLHLKTFHGWLAFV